MNGFRQPVHQAGDAVPPESPPTLVRRRIRQIQRVESGEGGIFISAYFAITKVELRIFAILDQSVLRPEAFRQYHITVANIIEMDTIDMRPSGDI